MVEAFQSLNVKSEEEAYIGDDIETNSSMATGGDSDASSFSDEEVLSNDAIRTKKVMYQLALGDSAAPAKPKDVVDQKLEEMIRLSRLRAASQKTKDDLEAPYNRKSSSAMDDVVLTGRPRSNSLPRDWDGQKDIADVDMRL
jgi:hypothetical protein